MELENGKIIKIFYRNFRNNFNYRFYTSFIKKLSYRIGRFLDICLCNVFFGNMCSNYDFFK